MICPESLITSHFKVMLRLAQVLAPLGRSYFLRCDGKERRCVVRDSNPAHQHFRHKPIDKGICDHCISQFDHLISQVSLSSIPMTIRFHKDFGVSSLLPNAVSDALLVSTKSLIFKSETRAFTDNELDLKNGWEHTSRELMFNTENAILEYDITRVFVFGQYIQSLSPFFAAKRRQRRAYIVDCPLVGNVRYDFVSMRTLPSMDLKVRYHREIFESSYKEKSYFDELGFSLALSHIKGLITKSSPWVYSSAPTLLDSDSLRKSLNVPITAKVLTAFISSPDELAASLSLSKAFEELSLTERSYSPSFLFIDQIDWLDWLDKIASQHNDLIILARSHPRLGKDPRSGIASTFLHTLTENANRWEHVRLIMPEDPVSSYDLMAISDAVTSMWSSTALEATYFGVPAIIPAFDSPTYPRFGSGVTLSSTIDEYKVALSDALDVLPGSKEVVIRWYDSINWLAFNLKSSLGVHIGHFDSYESGTIESVNSLVESINLADRHQVPEIEGIDWPQFSDIESEFQRFWRGLSEHTDLSIIRALLRKI